MREIEILVKVLESKNSALKKLSKYTNHHVSKIVDKYYYIPGHKGMIPSKNRNANEMFRLRTKNNKSFITFKKDVFSGKNWLYSDEYETEVKDINTMIDMFKLLGFKPLVTVNNTRDIYLYDDYEICLEDVKNLGLFLEIECLNPKNKSPTIVRKNIFDLIKTIGIQVSDEVQAGKAELLYLKLKK